MKKQGRPSAYKGDETDKQAYMFCLLGATDEELASNLSIRVSTLNNWKKRFPSFMESLKKGKEVADSKVASKLYTRALGYEYEEVTTEQDPKTKTIKRKTTIRHVPPDTTAQIFWLKNRRPDLWRDKQELTTDNSGALKIEFKNYGRGDQDGDDIPKDESGV